MKEQLLETLDLYFLGKLSPEEKKTVEYNLQHDAEWQKFYEQYLVANDAIELSIEQSLRSELTQLAQQQSKQKTETPRLSIVRRLATGFAIAASVALLIGFFGLNSYSDSSLANEYYTPFESGELRGDALQTSSITEALNAYHQKKYADAIKAFDAVPQDNPHFATAQYYKAHSLFQQKKYADAAIAFQAVSRLQDIILQEKAAWHTALSYLAADGSKSDAFKHSLQHILDNPNHSFHPQAQALQQNLNSIWKVF